MQLIVTCMKFAYKNLQCTFIELLSTQDLQSGFCFLACISFFPKSFVSIVCEFQTNRLLCEIKAYVISVSILLNSRHFHIECLFCARHMMHSIKILLCC